MTPIAMTTAHSVQWTSRARERTSSLTRWLHRVLSTQRDRARAPLSFDDFAIDARRPVSEQLNIFAQYGWPTGPPSPLHMRERMVGLAAERHMRALLAHAESAVTLARSSPSP